MSETADQSGGRPVSTEQRQRQHTGGRGDPSTRGRSQRASRGGRWSDGQQPRGGATPPGPHKQAAGTKASPQAGSAAGGVAGTGFVASIKDTFGFIQCARPLVQLVSSCLMPFYGFSSATQQGLAFTASKYNSIEGHADK